MPSTMRLRAAAVALLIVAATAVVACSAPAAPSSTGPAPAATLQPSSPVPAGAPEGTAKVEGSVQRISVDLAKGYYDPSVIHIKAGVPLEISFGQGSGCLSTVLVPDFSVKQDLSNGGAIVKLPAMKAGEYQFSCGMHMVFGKIVVQ
jgi:plastocyanin